jgi:uncharacterized protein (TIGR02145 family)
MSWGRNQYGLCRIPITKPCEGYYLRWWYNGWHYWFFLPGTIDFRTEGEKYFTLGTMAIAMGSGQVTKSQIDAIRTILNTKEVYIYTDSGWGNMRIERDSVIVYDNTVNGYEIEFVAVIGSRTISTTNGYTPVQNIPTIPPSTWVPDCTDGDCVLGTQIWMSCNYDISYPGSKVYDDDEANRTILGGLYTWDQVTAPGFCPTGYHVPTVAEWNTLITYLSGTAVAGGSLKESDIINWLAPNNIVSPVTCFEARGAGFYLGGYLGLGTVCNFWTADAFDTSRGYLAQMTNDDTSCIIADLPKSYFFSVRLIKDTVPYTGYGASYNYYAASKNGGTGIGSIAPAGWRVASRSLGDWDDIVSDLFGGDYTISGAHMKESGTSNWNTPNTGADNSTGFTALPIGERTAAGLYQSVNLVSYHWSNDDFHDGTAQHITFMFNSVVFGMGNSPYNKGYAIRLVKNTTSLLEGETGMMIDIDGFIYSTICIDGKEWMRENLRVTRYNDGTPIPEVTNDAAWAALATGARCYYNNTP